MTKSVSVLVGSLRQGSYARKFAQKIVEMFPEGYKATIVEIGDLPLYNFDYDDPSVSEVKLPESYTQFRETIKASDGVFFVTPENNRCIPACLKNAVDICSKPNNDVALKDKPAGIVSHSVGRMGGYSSQKNLRLALSYFDMKLPGQPEVFLGQSPALFDEAGNLNEKTAVFLQDYVNRFVELVEDHCCKCCDALGDTDCCEGKDCCKEEHCCGTESAACVGGEACAEGKDGCDPNNKDCCKGESCCEGKECC